MSTEPHLGELERQHAELERQIGEAMSHPSADDLKVRELKRQKLRIKDEIARLTGEGLAVF